MTNDLGDMVILDIRTTGTLIRIDPVSVRTCLSIITIYNVGHVIHFIAYGSLWILVMITSDRYCNIVINN